MATTSSHSDSPSPSRALRILLITHPEFVPPPSERGPGKDGAAWKAEQDVVWALRQQGHRVEALGVLDELLVIREAVAELRPHVVFNLMEEFDGVAQFDQNVVSYLECLRVRYTGCNPRGLMLARDKALTKKVLRFHEVATPSFLLVPRGRTVRRPAELTFPLIVKSATEEASLGIAKASVVHSDAQLAERVEYMHDYIGSAALVEHYIDGRELYVGLVGNARIEPFPVWELRFPDVPGPRVATRRIKWDAAYRRRNEIDSGPASDLPPGTAERAHRLCRKAYAALGLNGYARMDLRLSPDGTLHFIEANPNPHIGDGEDFAASAGHAGVRYGELLRRILRLALRWRPGRA